MVFSNRCNCSEPCEFRTDYAAVSSICFGLLNRYLCFSIPHPAKFHKRIYKLLQHMHIRTYTTNRHTCCVTRAVPHVLCHTCCAARAVPHVLCRAALFDNSKILTHQTKFLRFDETTEDLLFCRAVHHRRRPSIHLFFFAPAVEKSHIQI